MEREYKLNLIGEVIENYKIEKLIWHGGTSSIYKGISPNLNSHKIVAFKVLHQYRNTASQIKNFKKEFKILKKLSHPNIIEVYKFGQKSKLFYIVMEYFEGKNL
ncbi:MAG: protein kinase, partial [bacterium]|nr:protein kinase [bacterium]MDW8163855.1 protein kinase [Candidatus Omnitrophota bacterium]